MYQKYFLILFLAALLSTVIYLFGTFFISSNRNYSQERVVTEVESQEGIPGGHFSLKTHDGKIFNSFENQNPMLIYFGFTFCPDVCPITLLTMANVLDVLKEEEITPLFITVDPERDTREKLAEYLAYFQIGALGLTGTPDKIDAVVRQYGGYYTLNKQEESADYFADHSTYTYLIDQQGQVRFLFRHGDSPEYMAAVSRQLF